MSLPTISAHAAPTATDLYPGDDGSVAPASGLTGSDAAAAASNSSGASQSAQNGNSSPTDLSPIDDAAAAGSQAATASNPTTITGSIGGLAAGGATTTVAGAIGPVAAQTDPSASMAASAAGATVTSPAATGSAVNSIVVMPDRGLRETGPAEVFQAANPGDIVAANGGLVSDSSVDAAASGSQVKSSLDESATTDGLAKPLDGAGLLTRPADLLTEFLPFDRASVENAIDQLLERFEGMGGGMSTDLELATIMSAGSTLMAIAAVSTVMIVRRRSGLADRTATEEGLEKALGRIFDLTHSWEPEHS